VGPRPNPGRLPNGPPIIVQPTTCLSGGEAPPAFPRETCVEAGASCATTSSARTVRRRTNSSRFRNETQPSVRPCVRARGRTRTGGSLISGDEIIKIERHQIEQLVALGLGRYDAIRVVEAGIDCRTVESLVQEQGCPVGLAIEMAR